MVDHQTINLNQLINQQQNGASNFHQNNLNNYFNGIHASAPKNVNNQFLSDILNRGRTSNQFYSSQAPSQVILSKVFSNSFDNRNKEEQIMKSQSASDL